MHKRASEIAFVFKMCNTMLVFICYLFLKANDNNNFFHMKWNNKENDGVSVEHKNMVFLS